MPELLPIVREGDLRKSLKALRDDLAEAMDNANPAIKAQLAGRLQAVLTQLEALPETNRSVLDELGAKRADRESTAGVVKRPARRGKQRSG